MERMVWRFALRNSVVVPPRRAPFWMRVVPWRTRLRLLAGPLRPRVGRPRRFRGGPPMVPAPAMLGAVCCGAILAYFLDPDMGTRRRKMAVDRALGLVRRNAARTGRLARGAYAGAYAVTQRAIREVPPRLGRAEAMPDDATLAQRVESEIFRGTGVDKGRVNVSAEHGVVLLVGELDAQEQIDALGAAARRVPGVQDVENLLHLPGTPAPSKHHMAEAR